MNRRQLLISSTLLVTAATTPGCALIFTGAKEPNERSKKILWGWLIVDLVVGPWLFFFVPYLFIPIPIGLIIDFATGAIYKRNEYGRYKRDRAELEVTPEHADLAPMPLDSDLARVDACAEATWIARTARQHGLRRAGQELVSHIETCEHCQRALLLDSGQTQLVDIEPTEVAVLEESLQLGHA